MTGSGRETEIDSGRAIMKNIEIVGNVDRP